MNQARGAALAAERVLQLTRQIRARTAGQDDHRELAEAARRAGLALGGWLLPPEGTPEPEPPPARGSPRSLSIEAVVFAEDLVQLVADGRFYAARLVGERQVDADARLGPAAVAWAALHGRLRALDELAQRPATQPAHVHRSRHADVPAARAAK